MIVIVIIPQKPFLCGEVEILTPRRQMHKLVTATRVRVWPFLSNLQMHSPLEPGDRTPRLHLYCAPGSCLARVQPPATLAHDFRLGSANGSPARDQRMGRRGRVRDFSVSLPARAPQPGYALTGGHQSPMTAPFSHLCLLLHPCGLMIKTSLLLHTPRQLTPKVALQTQLHSLTPPL